MGNKHQTDEDRLYVWAKVFGSVLFMVTLSLASIAVLFLPLFHDDYEISEGVVIVIFGTLATSALALVEVQLRGRRKNGRPDDNEGEKD